MSTIKPRKRKANEGERENDEDQQELTLASLINTTSCLMLENVVVVPRMKLNELKSDLISQRVLEKITLEQRPLPVRLRLKVPDFLHQLFFGGMGERNINDPNEIERSLGLRRKMLNLGSYAIIEPPVIVRYQPEKKKTYLQFRYTVFNEHDVRQWPDYYGK